MLEDVWWKSLLLRKEVDGGVWKWDEEAERKVERRRRAAEEGLGWGNMAVGKSESSGKSVKGWRGCDAALAPGQPGGKSEFG